MSFKDPQDFDLAGHVAALLERAGFAPYLAREDNRVGAEYWTGKIEPAIAAAEGTLVIWTPNAVRKPDSVLRELRYSRTVGTPVGVFLEKGADLPGEYPANELEYGGPFERNSAFFEFAKGVEACARRWREGRPFF